MKRKRTGLEPAPPRPADILRELDAQLIVIDGTTISKREAHLRIVYARALNGDPKSSRQLQQVRDACGLDRQANRVGCLLLPEPPSSLEEFERMAYEQQQQFRENPLPEDSP